MPLPPCTAMLLKDNLFRLAWAKVMRLAGRNLGVLANGTMRWGSGQLDLGDSGATGGPTSPTGMHRQRMHACTPVHASIRSCVHAHLRALDAHEVLAQALAQARVEVLARDRPRRRAQHARLPRREVKGRGKA